MLFLRDYMANIKEEVYGWLMKCTVCGTIWVLEVSFDIRDAKRLYHYCLRCKRNTFHEVLDRIDGRSIAR